MRKPARKTALSRQGACLLTAVWFAVLSACGPARESGSSAGEKTATAGTSASTTQVTRPTTARKTTAAATTTTQAVHPEWRGVEISTVDFRAYENSLSREDWLALSSYFPVLLDGAVFRWTAWDYKGEPEDIPLSGLLTNSHSYLRHSDTLLLNSFTLFDMDGDGVKELILCFGNLDAHYLILHREGNAFYGADRVLRGFLSLQTNGVFYGSSGVFNGDYCKLIFQNNKFYEQTLAKRVGDGTEAGQKYYIGDREVNEDEFTSWEKEIHVGSVDWIYVVKD